MAVKLTENAIQNKIAEHGMDRTYVAESAIDPELEDLYTILSYKRHAGSDGELAFIREFLLPIDSSYMERIGIPNHRGLERDEYGNYYLRIGTAPVMWSCHTDTVHSFAESSNLLHMHNGEKVVNPPQQKLGITEDGTLSSQNGTCLGADNGAGIWLMLRMIQAKKEGLYIFHREEEIGGRGSKFISQITPEVVEGIKYAIAFDRKGFNSVITHQGYRTCSDEFGMSVIAELKKSGLNYRLDDTGVFTDTANYSDIIPECTNLSAGFLNEHSWHETLNTSHLVSLLNALLAFDINNLEVHRDTSDPVEWASDWWFLGNKNNELDGYGRSNRDYYEELCYRHPHAVVAVLKSYGILDEVMNDVEIALM